MNINTIIHLFHFSTITKDSINGRCDLLPVLVSYNEGNNERKEFFGYVCPNSDIEKYQEINSSNKNHDPISATYYKNIVLLLRKGVPTVEKIEITLLGVK